MVPFLYLVYARTGLTLSAQTVVAHATSLGVAFVAATTGTWRYSRAKAIYWREAATFAVPGVVSAFITARVLTKVDQAHWVRAAFGGFLLITALDMARRARKAMRSEEDNAPRSQHSYLWLVLVGFLGGALSALLGIGGGLIAVPILLYVGKLPVKACAPTALAGVTLTTLSGGLSYLTAGPGPAISDWMVGFVDFRMALPLAAGALVTVPLGVKAQRKSSGPTLFWLFSGVFTLIGISLIVEWWRHLQ